MTLNRVMAVTSRYFTEFGKHAFHHMTALQKTIMAKFMQESIVFLVRVQCRRKESSRSLSHLLMSFLSKLFHSQNRKKNCNNTITKDPNTPLNGVTRNGHVVCVISPNSVVVGPIT